MGYSRLEAFSRMGKVQVLEPLAKAAHREYEEGVWRGDIKDSDHGEPWHISNHVSSFPGDDPRACIRKLAYGLADFPENEPFSHMLRGTMIVGEAIEDWLVERLDLAGRIVSASVEDEHQTRFEDADHWLGGSPDLVILPYRWNRLHVVECKSKDGQVILDMKNGQRAWDPGHRIQTNGYIGLGHEISPMLWPSVVICEETWRIAYDDGGVPVCRTHDTSKGVIDGGCLKVLQLEPIQTGSIYYHSRERPHITQEYFFELDPNFMGRGRAELRKLIAHFEKGEIPPHPFGGKQWSERPCQYCPYKKFICKPDHQKGIDKMSDSHGISFAREVRGEYSYEDTFNAVLERWKGKRGVYPREIDINEEERAA